MNTQNQIEVAVRAIIDEGRIPELWCDLQRSNCGAAMRVFGELEAKGDELAKAKTFSTVLGPVSQRSLVFGETTVSFSAKIIAGPIWGLQCVFNIDYDGIDHVVVSADGDKPSQVLWSRTNAQA